MPDRTAENLRRIRACDAEWDESKHNRADNGQFSSGGGGGGAAKKPPAAKGKKSAPAAAAINPKVTAHGLNGTNMSLRNYIASKTLNAPGLPFDPGQAANKIFTDLVKKHKMDPEAICKELNSRDDFYGKFKPWHKLVDGVALLAEDRMGNKTVIKIRTGGK
jgi:hypothetical protein